MSEILLQSANQMAFDSQKAERIQIPTYVLASVFASICIIIGLIWDISWHTSIGRDGLLSPPHLVIYVGAVVAGIFSGFKVLKITFAGSAAELASTVKFWGIFRGSLGALFCIWGAIAMLTSAPFDDWWHNTYGLDIEILSPPHSILAMGMMMIQFGAMISSLSLQNSLDHEKNTSAIKWLYIVASGLLLVSIFTLFSEFLGRHQMHGTLFYQISAFVFPLFLIAVSNASKMKWAATNTAIVYSFILAALVWILPLFPAEPLLGPIYNPITHYQAFEFPLLLIVPAIFLDLIIQKFGNNNAWFKSMLLGIAFVISFLAVQWPFGDFLMSTYARNWFFGTESLYFGVSPDWEYRYKFWTTSSGFELIKGLIIAILFAIISARIGLSWGNWMKQVRR